jgi:hypothetical protein
VRTTINHAIDIIQIDVSEPSDENKAELVRVIRRVQSDYLEIIETALSLLIQNKDDECQAYLQTERSKVEDAKLRIGDLVSQEELWTDPFHRSAIEYLYTRARLVDEIRMFPDFALQLLERLTLDQSKSEMVAYLETAMTGKKGLYEDVIN